MHDHDHSHGTASSPEETLALLEYMLGHNHDAVEDFNQGNEKLAKVLSALKGE